MEGSFKKYSKIQILEYSLSMVLLGSKRFVELTVIDNRI
ncbi:hypothetical protein LEP1GSC013_2242 [Leptospira interrogans serovar Valbuzzi str. Duyster]|nr:hypothetical protein LEP1GSC013_2242 [Leptospira interrogans serovar Valbuzzi str. Duyster]